jgi:MFS family permease
VLSIINTAFPGRHRARALSIYGVVLGLAAVGGQIVGGALVQLDLLHLSWRGCFLVNVPVGIVAVALAAQVVPESQAPERAVLDLGGAALLAFAVLAVLVPLTEGPSDGWPLWTWLSLGCAPLVGGLFVAHQARIGRRGDVPLLDLGLFAQRSFSAGLLTQICLAAAQASFFVYLALYLQQGRGLGALDAGLLFGILALAYVLASGPAPRLTEQFGGRVVGAGGVSLAAGLGILAVVVGRVGTGGSWLALVPGLVLAGAGIGLSYTPLTSIVLARLEPARAGAAAGALATVQQIGYAIGVALTGLIFFAAAHTGIARAFELSLLELTALGVGVAGCARLLPGREAAGRK